MFAIQGWSQAALNEGFEGTVFPPNDWRIETTSGSGNWTSSATIAHSGTKAAKSIYSDSPFETSIKWLITPKLVVTAAKTSFSFWIATDDWYPDGDNIDIFVSTTSNAVASFGTTPIFSLNENTVSETWTQHTVDLTAYIGQEIFVAIRVMDFFGFSTFIDDVTGPNLFVPSCPKPTALTVSSPTTSGIDLGWTDATGSVWNIQYILASSNDWTTATTITGVTNPYSFTTLNTATSYKARVQTVCGAEQSEWSFPITFTTSCDAIATLPYIERFDTYGTTAGTFPICWSRPILNTSTPFPSIVAANHSAPASMKFESASASVPTYVVTPPFADDINTLRVKFWLKAEHITNSGTMEVGVMSDPTDLTTFEHVGTITPTTGSWKEYEFMFNGTALAGQNKHIAFKHITNLSNYYYWLDDVVVDNIPNCIKPSTLTSTEITTTGAKITWSPGSSADNSWWMYFKTASQTQYDSLLVSTNPFVLTNLQPSSVYNLYIVTDCDVESSEKSDVLTFFTACGIVTSLPLNEDFNSYALGTFPQCWSRPVLYSGFPKIATSQYHSSPSSIEIHSLPNIPSYVISPELGIDINTLQVRFWAKAQSAASSGILEVGVMSDPTDITTFELAGLASPSTTNWEEYEIAFNNTTLSGTNKYIAFRQNSAFDWYFWLDDVEINTIASCGRPTALIASNLTQSSADIAFTPGNALDTEWKVYYRPIGTTTWTEEDVYAIPYQMTGLIANTVYEVNIKTLCGDASYSSTSPTINFRTACDYITTIPYSETFDSYGAGTSATSYPSCWTRNVSNYTAAPNSPYIATTNFSAPGSMYFYASNNTRVVAVCNPVDPSIPINTLTVGFKMRYTSLDQNGIQVGVMTDPNDFSTFVPLGNPQLLSSVGVWEDKVVILSSYQGTGNYIALAAIAPANQYARAHVDNFTIDYTSTCPNIYDLSLGVVTTTSVGVDWDNSFVDPTGWSIAYSQTPITSFDTASSTIIPVPSFETLPFVVSNLTPGATYTFAVKNACGGAWSLPKEITLPLSAVTLPYTQNFEDLTSVSEWSFSSSNTTQTDMWCIGSAVGNTGNSMYVSADGGITNSYSQTSTYTYATALVEFDQSSEFTLSFDWKAGGESGYDRFSVYALPLSAPMPTTGYPTGGVTLLSPSDFQPTWQNKSIMIPHTPFANTVQRLVFVWYSNYATIVNPSVAVDNIVIEGLDCATPTNLAASNISQTSANITWNEIGSATSWQLYYKESTSANYTSTIVTDPSPFILNSLTPNTLYNVYIVANCGTETSNASPVVNFRTECAAITTLPYTENFESYGIGAAIMPACWIRTSTYADRPYVASGGLVGNCLYFYAGAATYNIAAMTSIDASIPINTLMARFYYKNLYATDKLTIGVMTDPSDATTFDSITTITGTSSWAVNEVDFSSYQGLGQYIAFKNTYTTNTAYGYIDNLTVDYIPSCTRPASLYASNITSISAEIEFTAGSQSDTDWRIYYRTSGETIWIEENLVSIPFLITGLTPNTEYEVYLTTLCSDNSYSDASQILSFRTECSPITTLPYSENFDTYGTGQTIMPACWIRNTNYEGYPYVYTTGHVGNCLYFYAGLGKYNIAAMTAIDATIPINTLTARFYYRNSALTDRLIVGVMTDPTDTSTFVSVATIQSDAEYSWSEYEVNFSTYTGSGQYIAFKNAYTTTYSYAYIDDLIVDVIPDCARPTTLSATGQTTNMDVSFVPGNSTDSEWYIFYKPSSASVWDSVQALNTTTTIPNLILQTAYEIYVKTHCSDGSYSEASQIITYTTPCTDVAISTFPWTEGFEGGLACWQQEYVLGTVDWASFSPYNTAHSGTGFAFFHYDDLGGNKTKLISPTLDITGLSSPYISFWHSQEAWDIYQDKLKVFYRTSPTDTWTQLFHYTTDIVAYRMDSLALPNASSTYQIAFEGEGNWGEGIRIDDITVYDLSDNPCATPTDLIAIPSNTTVYLTWTAGDEETSWEVKLGLDGIAEMVSNPNHTITGITAGVTYVVYIRANCGFSYSSWEMISFTTTNEVIAPTVTTVVPLGQITQTSATLNATYVLGTDAILTKGFDYKEASASTWIDQVVTTGTTPFTHSLVGLTSNTAYEVKAYVSTATEGKVYGNTVTFTTLTTIPPTVTTDSVFVLSASSANFYGTITQRSEAIEARGFEYKLDTENWNDAISISASGTNNITATPTTLALTATTIYQVRAYGKTLSGKTYGQVVSFTLLGLNGVNGQEISIMMYPNPATSQTRLIVSGVSGETKIILSDVQGRTLKTINAKPVSETIEQTIELNNLAKGVYYIRIQNSDINRTQKLIVK